MNVYYLVQKVLVRNSCKVIKQVRNCYFKPNQANNLKMGVPLKQLIQKLELIAPLNTAEGWDNVGLLVEPVENIIVKKVLLTIDLTESVVNEALETNSNLIVSYHPNIFKPLKTVTNSTWKERIVAKCIKNDIAIFSPHTSWDAMTNGVNDWLGSALKPQTSKPILPNATNPEIGMGRLLTLTEPLTLADVIELIKAHIGIKYLRVGVAEGKSVIDKIGSVALCAGSGSSVLAGTTADLYLTGEMLHHDVLDATQRGIHVILCNHSDSERGFLTLFKNRLTEEPVSVITSKKDKDCLTTM